MKKYDKFWCWWLHRYLLFIVKDGANYIFEDFGDKRFVFDTEKVMKLERR